MSNGTLYEVQPDLEPITFTHWDCWFPDGSDTTDRDCVAFDDASLERKVERMEKILANWNETLDCGLTEEAFWSEDYSTLLGMIQAVGWDNTWKLILFRILQHGYGVFEGSDFIEIYAGIEEEGQ